MGKNNFLLVFSLLIYIFFVSPFFFEWGQIVNVISLLIIIEILWIGRVFPLAFTSLILIILISFHFVTYDEIISFVGTGVVWLLFSTFIISNAFIKSGLAYRISLHMLKWSRGKGRLLILISFFLMFVLSIFVPSNIGRGSLVSSLLDSIIANLKNVGNVKNLSKALFIGISYIISLSGAIVATGASSTIYAFGMFLAASEKLNYIKWILLFAPPIFLFILFLWVVLQLLYPLENVDRKEIINFINRKLLELGTLKRSELKMIFIIGITVILWMMEPYHGYSIPLIGLFGAILTMMPYVGIWGWEEAKNIINWDMILFFASTLMLSHVLLKTGTIDWFANRIVSLVSYKSSIFILIVMISIVALLRIIFVNILGFMTIVIPLALIVGQHTMGISPIIMAMAVFMTGIPGFFLITQSPVHMISFSYGYFTEKDLLRTGIIAVFIWLGIITASVYYWKLII